MYQDGSNVIRSQINLDIGYDFHFYENFSTTKSFHERIKFPSGKGLSLCYPERGNVYNIDLYPCQSKLILFR